MQRWTSHHPVRPCGPYDGRLTGHRCIRCRLDHTACDGRRPCTNCIVKHVVCRSPSNSSGDMAILSYRPEECLGAVRKPLVAHSSLYTTVFFDAVDPRTQPLIDSLSFHAIGHLVHCDEFVHNAVVALGATYASRQRIDTIPARDPGGHLPNNTFYTNFRTETLSRLQTVNSHQSVSVFVCALLLSIAELIIDKSGMRWRLLLHKIYIHVVRPRGPYGFPGSLQKALLTLFRHCDALRAAMFSEDISFGDDWWHSIEISPLPVNDHGRNNDANWAELVLEFAERWAGLRFRSLMWSRKSEESMTDKDHLNLGENIIHEAILLEKRITDYVPLLMSRRYGGQGTTPVSVMSYYYWGLIGLSRMFIDPRWQLLGQRFHMMDEWTIHQCAMAALACVESRVTTVELEAMLYAPLLNLLALESRTLEERHRIIKSLRGIRSKGFPIAETVESDLRIAWAAVSGSVPN